MHLEPSPDRMPELGFYTLAGHSASPRDCAAEAQDAERIGIGSVLVSERFNVKEACTLCGAVGAVSEDLGIVTSATNLQTRHPMVTAAFANTMHQLTGGRFAFGLGRGIEVLGSMYGIQPSSMSEMESFTVLMRRLWAGEMVGGVEHHMGSSPLMFLQNAEPADIPVVVSAIGPRTLEWAGGVMDGVILHTYFSDEATARSVEAVRRGAEKAGRDPSSVRIWSVLATVGDHLGHDLVMKKTVGRLATYLQGYGEVLLAANGWDPAPLDAFRSDEVVSSVPGAIDAVATTEQLEHIATLFPAEWLDAAATGTAQQCARTALAQFDLGVDSVVLHGATPLELEPVVQAYRGIRPAGRFDDLPVNPGWM